MGFIIATRNPRNKKLIVITDGEGDNPDIAEFATEDLANRAALSVPVCEAWGYSVVEIARTDAQ